MPANPFSGEWSSLRYHENARFVSDLGEPVVRLLDPQPGERILDLGCGDGVLTKKIASTGAKVVGIDGSADMIAAARRNGVDATLADAHELNFEAEFDAVFSNAALHWMKRDPDLTIAGVYRAIKPGGRFVAEMGGHGNVAAICVALFWALENYGVDDCAAVNPWYFPSVSEYRKKLEGRGFEVDYIELIPRPTPLPTGMRGWLETFAMAFTRVVAQERRAAFLDEVTRRLRPVLCDSKGQWTADYVRLRFLARSPKN
ncbi:MAG: methyltransferase domain-containing protein [Acidobacteria bacterium]|nr:methyltransferase domain-containing protein [Acidobacteriota bacterium]